MPADPASAARPDADAALVGATLAGDDHAFDQLIHRHHVRVFSYLLQLTRHRQDAEDLAQQTFIKAYTHLARFDPTRPLPTWLLTIAHRTALNHFRSTRRWEELPEHTPGTAPDPAEAAACTDQADNLWARARTLLSRRDFEVLWLRCGEEFSVRETADILGLTATHVKILLFRARRTLQHALRP